jgi:hypothetical protein
MTSKRPATLTAEQLVADVEQGILNEDVESYMPGDLFGPPTAAELAASDLPVRSATRDGATAPTNQALSPANRSGHERNGYVRNGRVSDIASEPAVKKP